jgi:hypothetical protein
MVRERIAPGGRLFSLGQYSTMNTRTFRRHESRQLLCDLLVEDLLDGQGDDNLAGFAEEGVDFGQGVVGVVEGDEEALGAVLAGHDGLEGAGFVSSARAGSSFGPCPLRGMGLPARMMTSFLL